MYISNQYSDTEFKFKLWILGECMKASQGKEMQSYHKWPHLKSRYSLIDHHTQLSGKHIGRWNGKQIGHRDSYEEEQQ